MQVQHRVHYHMLPTDCGSIKLQLRETRQRQPRCMLLLPQPDHHPSPSYIALSRTKTQEQLYR